MSHLSIRQLAKTFPGTRGKAPTQALLPAYGQRGGEPQHLQLTDHVGPQPWRSVAGQRLDVTARQATGEHKSERESVRNGQRPLSGCPKRPGSPWLTLRRTWAGPRGCGAAWRRLDPSGAVAGAQRSASRALTLRLWLQDACQQTDCWVVEEHGGRKYSSVRS